MTKRTKMKRRQRWLAGLLCGCALGLVACRKSSPDAEPAAVAVQAEHPTTGDMSEEITVDAVLTPQAEAAIVPKISAPIEKELVQRGAHVKQGQLLLTLESKDLRGGELDSQGGLAQAQAAYATATQATIPEDVQKAQQDVALAKANLDVAQRTAEERRRLQQEGAIAGRDVDLATAAAVDAQGTYDAAVKHLEHVRATTQKSAVEAAAGQLNSAKGRQMSAAALASYASLRSPIDGVVTDRPLFPGETAPAGTAVITVMDTSNLIAKLHISPAVALRLRVGAPAEIEIPGIDEPQAAKVALISPALDAGSSTVEVWLKLPNPGGHFLAGTPVHAVLHGAAFHNAVQVPTAAILPADDGSTVVLVAGADGVAHKRAVKTGIRTEKAVQILDGVTTADLVVTQGGYGLDDGTKVKVGAKDDAGDKQ